jgi:hypothetical protein
VPEEIQRAAREMGKKAYQERLKQIRMDPVDAELYQKFSSSVQKQVLNSDFFLNTKLLLIIFMCTGNGPKSYFEQHTSKRQRATMDQASDIRRFRRF